MPITNNVTRMLDSKKIIYLAHALPEEKVGAIEAAEMIGLPPEQVFKTIVAVRPKGGKAVLALVPAHQELDLKALAKALGEKKIALASHAEAEKLTGLQTGGISPLALINKGFQVVADASFTQHAQVALSGGQRGLNLQLAPGAVVKLVNARLSPISG
ncbi:MAG: YbaK/EbsC family protein [Chloroflexota bacterium]